MTDLSLRPGWESAVAGLERAVERKPPKPNYWRTRPYAAGVPFSIKVVGVTFVPGYPDNLYRLADLARIDRDLAGWDASIEPGACPPHPVLLIPDPDNAFDPNAVNVHAPSLGEWSHIGYVAAKIALRMSPALLEGQRIMAHVVQVLVVKGREANPGLKIECVALPADS